MNDTSTLTAAQQTSLWIGSIMGSVAILMLIGIWFTWKYTDTFSVWLQRVRIWHDPAIVELQNVHSNHFFEGFMKSKRGARHEPQRHQGELAIQHPTTSSTPLANRQRGELDPKISFPFNEHGSQLDSHAPHPPASSISQTDSEGWSEASLAFPAATAISPLHNNSASERPSAEVYTLVQRAAPVLLRSATPESQRTVRRVPASDSQNSMTVTNSLMESNSKSAYGESAWTDDTSVTDEWASVDMFRVEKANVVADKQRVLYRRLLEKGKSPEEAQGVLTGRPISGSSSTAFHAHSEG